jgi:hypothetical protein
VVVVVVEETAITHDKIVVVEVLCEEEGEDSPMYPAHLRPIQATTYAVVRHPALLQETPRELPTQQLNAQLLASVAMVLIIFVTAQVPPKKTSAASGIPGKVFNRLFVRHNKSTVLLRQHLLQEHTLPLCNTLLLTFTL